MNFSEKWRQKSITNLMVGSPWCQKVSIAFDKKPPEGILLFNTPFGQVPQSFWPVVRVEPVVFVHFQWRTVAMTKDLPDEQRKTFEIRKDSEGLTITKPPIIRSRAIFAPGLSSAFC
jgi:hypothetical protein